MNPSPEIQTRNYSYESLKSAIGEDMVQQFEEVLSTNDTELIFPVGWILGYSPFYCENDDSLRGSIHELSEDLKLAGCELVFALIEWEDSKNWQDQRKKTIEMFQSLGWLVSQPFAVMKF